MILKILLLLTILETAGLQNMHTHRKLFIFGGAKNKSEIDQELELLNTASEGLKERALNIILVEKNSALFKKYDVKQDLFTVILVGKDGSEKYRTHKLLLPEKLFALIDAMPMRRAEMKKQ